MTNHPLPERAKNISLTLHEGVVDEKIHSLITLLLQRLIEEIGDIHQGKLVIRQDGAGQPVEDERAVYATVRRPDPQPDSVDPKTRDPKTQDLKEVQVEAPLVDGQVVTLITGAGEDPQGAQDVARRFLSPIVTSLNLGLSMSSDRTQAQRAVDVVEQMALLDLATGIVMARRRIDPCSARDALAAWSDRTGTSINDLTPSSMLELLTGEEL